VLKAGLVAALCASVAMAQEGPRRLNDTTSVTQPKAVRRVFILTDLEGVAGVVSFEDQSYPTGRYYEQAKRLLTAEVNAAVNGLLEAGVEDVLVWDGHGAGGIWYEDLHPAARLMHGRLASIEQVFSEVAKCDAAIIVGQHAMAGTPTSNQSHTQDSRRIEYYKLNGKPIGEIAQFCLYAGAVGVPVIMLAGERDACQEAEALIPSITTVSVKQGLGRNAAISLSPARARQAIQEGAARAVRNQNAKPLRPLVWAGPYVLEKRFYKPEFVPATQPGVERVDDRTMRLRGEDVTKIIYR
jgi:D-amino peptidase